LVVALLTACDKNQADQPSTSPNTDVELTADPLKAVQEGMRKALALPVYGTVSKRTTYEGTNQPPIRGDYDFAMDPKAKLTRVAGKDLLLGDFEIIVTAEKLYVKGSLAKTDTWSALDLSRFPPESPIVGGFGDVYSYAGALKGLISCEKATGKTYNCLTSFAKWRDEATSEAERKNVDAQIAGDPTATEQPVEVRVDDQGG
jgi:hypothetical protein